MKKLMHICMGLVLLPPEQIEGGLGETQRLSSEVHAQYRNGLDALLLYIQQWIESKCTCILSLRELNSHNNS